MIFEFRTIQKKCENCGTLLILNNNRDIIRKRFCSRECNGNFTSKNHSKDFKNKARVWLNTPQANKKKGHPGPTHPNWIKDRSKLKHKRSCVEERKFIQDIIRERNYTCEITGKRGGKLSVHHKNGVRDFPHLRFDRSNVIVIKRDIHKRFHCLYGTISITENKWKQFVENKEYACCQ